MKALLRIPKIKGIIPVLRRQAIPLLGNRAYEGRGGAERGWDVLRRE